MIKTTPGGAPGEAAMATADRGTGSRGSRRPPEMSKKEPQRAASRKKKFENGESYMLKVNFKNNQFSIYHFGGVLLYDVTDDVIFPRNPAKAKLFDTRRLIPNL